MIERRVTVVGCGHVGLVTAAGLAHLGHRVTGLDIRLDVVNQLNRSTSPFFEEGLSELLVEGRQNGRLAFTTDYGEALAAAEFVFLAVDTPTTPSGAADLTNIRAATQSIRTHMPAVSPIIVNKSTSPVGTGETIASIVRAGLGDGGPEPRVVSNPEFLREGRAVEDFLNPDRIVIGSSSEADSRAVADLYGLPAEQLAGQRDVRLASSGIVLWQRQELDPRCGASELADELGQLEHAEFHGVAQVHRPCRGRIQQAVGRLPPAVRVARRIDQIPSGANLDHDRRPHDAVACASTLADPADRGGRFRGQPPE